MYPKTSQLSSLFIVGTLIAADKTAHADNINTSATICHSMSGVEQGDINYSGGAVFNRSTQSRIIVCPIPRSPLPAGASLTFFVDGSNLPNSSTDCTLTVYDSNSTASESQRFVESTGSTFRSWHHPVNLSTPAGISQSWQAIVQCTLPGNNGGFILGVTSVQ